LLSQPDLCPSLAFPSCFNTVSPIRKSQQKAGFALVEIQKNGFSLIELNDGSCMKNLQVVVDSSVPGDETGIRDVTTGASISVDGILKESSGKGQRMVTVHSHLILQKAIWGLVRPPLSVGRRSNGSENADDYRKRLRKQKLMLIL
jgi:aspartyl/asparaginyl-tRNA synthetase